MNILAPRLTPTSNRASRLPGKFPGARQRQQPVVTADLQVFYPKSFPEFFTEKFLTIIPKQHEKDSTYRRCIRQLFRGM
jgi:hypothetical protein